MFWCQSIQLMLIYLIITFTFVNLVDYPAHFSICWLIKLDDLQVISIERTSECFVIITSRKVVNVLAFKFLISDVV